MIISTGFCVAWVITLARRELNLILDATNINESIQTTPIDEMMIRIT
ncbi:hypothetical protein [Nostoc sp.]